MKENNMYNLFLDDVRQPCDCIKYLRNGPLKLYSEGDWLIAKDYSDFVAIVTELGLPEVISFDHDLGEEHYGIEFQDWNDYSSNDLGVAETGFDAAKWLINYCMDRNLPLPECHVHSMNPVGKKNIQLLLEQFKSYQDG